MTFITAEELQQYQNKFVSDEQLNIVQSYCRAAMEKVANFLGYNPQIQDYITAKFGSAGTLLALEAQPIIELKNIFAGETQLNKNDFFIKGSNYISFKNKKIFDCDCLYTVAYTAGFVEVPSVIKICALQLASLYWESSGGNLAVSSTSFADTGSRVFNNFTADRFLQAITDYRILHF
ncbi:hypothetical protein [Treponema pectinovorum]|uniref:hypothetical protein n=1 Tax=Treponema pectinovorum TaxID=164 RepID=UPI0011CA38D6|nr:hypothetical protein [Treponema pectinovorum]